jgi:hypothetical protein
VEPVVPLLEVDQFVLDARRAVLIEYLGYRPGKPLGVVVREFLIVVQQHSSMVVSSVKRFEILDVVREQDDSLICTPLEEFDIVTEFPQVVDRRLLDVFVSEDAIPY